jgi:four helix bundle protein
MNLGFENLQVWKRSVDLSVQIYKHFKKCNDYSFTSQITRSSLSISSNISERYERESLKDKNRFYTIPKGSAGELRTQIIIGVEIGYIEKATGEGWTNETRELSAMLTGLIKSNLNKS